ncbi:MAG: lysophospholipase [Lentisphaerae bacterium]|nr:lysophospholipase [Lentisphaerota bacterium]
MKTILFQGDSITDCCRARDAAANTPGHLGYGYVNLISSELLGTKPEEMYRCINKGISGNRVVDLYARWKIDALNFSPDVISILIGVNDVWHEVGNQNGVEADRFEQVYRMLLEWTKKVLPEVKLLIMEPFALISDVVDEAFMADVKVRAGIAEKLAAEFGAVYLPLQNMLNEATKLAPNSYWLADGVHPSPAGNKLIADAWLKAAADLL